MPARLQRSRASGWRMPEGAVYVGRPTRWGNPYRSGPAFEAQGIRVPALTAEDTVRLYREAMTARIRAHPHVMDDLRGALAGRDLVCWCRPEQPCHADVLLDLANAPTCSAVELTK